MSLCYHLEMNRKFYSCVKILVLYYVLKNVLYTDEIFLLNVLIPVICM